MESERLFSTASIIIDERSRLTAEKAEMLMFLFLRRICPSCQSEHISLNLLEVTEGHTEVSGFCDIFKSQAATAISFCLKGKLEPNICIYTAGIFSY